MEKTKQFKSEEKQKPKNESGIVEFEDINKLKKKKIRGLLRKRAKKYECT